MISKLNKCLRQESGITALETAIILIAFVVVAAIFAFSILTTGTFLTERSKESAYAGLQEVRGSLALKGSVVLENTGDTVVFNVAPVSGGASVDLSRLKLSFRDSTTNRDLTYDNGITPGANEWVATDLALAPSPVVILKSSELAKIKVKLAGAVASNHTFAIQITPPTGGVLLIERSTPSQIDQVTDLH